MPSPETEPQRRVAIGNRPGNHEPTLRQFDDGSVNRVWNTPGTEYDFRAQGFGGQDRGYGGSLDPYDITGITVQNYDDGGTKTRYVFIEWGVVMIDTDENGRSVSRVIPNAHDLRRKLETRRVMIGGTCSRLGGSKILEIYGLQGLPGTALLPNGHEVVHGRANPLVVGNDIYRSYLEQQGHL